MEKVNIIDIGSAGDIFSPWRENKSAYDYLLKFEPRENSQEEEKIISRDCAVWEENCVRPFYIYKGLNGTGSSLFMQNYEYVGQNLNWLSRLGNPDFASSWFDRSSLIKTLQVECKKLDTLLSEIDNRPTFHLLKIDAQGAEFEILNGAIKYLTSECLALHIELFNIPMYKGIRLYSEVKLFLETLNFKEVKKFTPHGTFDCAQDSLFVRNDLPANTLIQRILDIYEL